MFFKQTEQIKIWSNAEFIPVIDLRLPKKTSIFKKNYKKIFKTLIYIIIISLMIFSSFFYVSAETNPIFTQNNQNNRVKNGKIFVETKTDDNTLIADIKIDPKNQAINAVGIYLNFSSSTLQAKEMDFENSFCKLFIEKKIDNIKGQIKVLCGLPTPGINKKATIVRVIFDKKSPGWTDLSFSKYTQLLANDGFGTNILEKTQIHNLYIQ